MINHISRQSPEFQDFQRRGRASPSADLFITLDKVWPDGEPPAEDVARIFLRKPDAPFSTVTIERHRRARAGLDVVRDRGLVRADRPRRHLAGDARARSPAGCGRSPGTASGSSGSTRSGTSSRSPARPASWSNPRSTSSSTGSTEVAGSLRAGRSCPRSTTYPRRTNGCRRTASGRTTSSCPASSCTTFETGDAERLAAHLDGSPDRQFTTLDCHDGIPVRPDLDGILDAGRDARPGGPRRAPAAAT